MKQKNSYNLAVDGLRILSLLAVVMIHTTTRTIETSGFHLGPIWWTLFLNQAARFAVPLFFMISGFVLELNYEHHPNYFAYLWKRINRILIPYVFWSALYYLFIYPQHGASFWSTLLYGSASWQLYFIPTVLIFYIIFPVIHQFYALIANKWILMLLTAVQIWLLWHDYHVKSFDLFYPLGIALLNYLVFILGMLASRNQQAVVEVIKRWWVGLSLGMIGIVGVVYYQAMHGYNNTHNYLMIYSQWRVSILVYTLLLAAVVYGGLTLFNPSKEVIKKVAQLSFFVFFVHIIVLENVWKYIFLPNVSRSGSVLIYQWWFDPLFFGVTAAGSFLLAWGVHKVPLLQRLTG